MILISPFAQQLPDGENPKNYPYFPEVIVGLHAEGFKIKQISGAGSILIPGVDEHLLGAKLTEVRYNIERCITWISVDSFFHHYATSIGKSGVVIFGPSDPEIFGHPSNTNLLKDRKFIRPDQYNIWSGKNFSLEPFVEPDVVVKATLKLISFKGGY